MANEVAKPMNFEDRMMQMMRESAGTLFTDQELKKIVEKALEKMFFEERHVPNPSIYSSERILTKPPLALELIQNHLKDQVKAAVDSYFKENPEKVIELIDKIVREGILTVLAKQLQGLFDSSLATFGINITNQIRSMSNMG